MGHLLTTLQDKQGLQAKEASTCLTAHLLSGKMCMRFPSQATPQMGLRNTPASLCHLQLAGSQGTA